MFAPFGTVPKCLNHMLKMEKSDHRIACVADETKPRYSPSANQRPKACSVLPGFSIIGSYWLLHMAVFSCTVTVRVAWNHGYAGGYTT